MKSVKKEDLTKLLKIFAATYRNKEGAEVGDPWQTRVMGRIHDLDPLQLKIHFMEVFQRFVWRLAPVAIILVLLLGAAITQLDMVSDYAVAEMFMEDPADFSLLAMNGR